MIVKVTHHKIDTLVVGVEVLVQGLLKFSVSIRVSSKLAGQFMNAPVMIPLIVTETLTTKASPSNHEVLFWKVNEARSCSEQPTLADNLDLSCFPFGAFSL